MKAVTRELAALRSEWRLWARGGPHPEATGLVCLDRCGDCEACAATAWRRDRMDEIQATAAALKGAG